MKTRSMKKWLAAVALLLAVTAGAYTTGTSLPTIVVDNTAGDQSRPRVSGNFASYNVVTTGGANIIGFYDFAAASRAVVPSDPATQFDSLSDVSGNNIVFSRVQGATSSIWEFSLVSQIASEVAPTANALRQNPTIGGNTVAWEDIGVSADMNSEIVLTTDGTTTHRVTNDPLADQNPRVSPSGTMVVWEKCSASCNVYAALAPAWAPQVVANSAANETSPDTNGTQIVYASNAGGTEHVYVTTLGGIASQIPSTTTSQDHPAIVGNFVAYEGGGDIWVFDLSSGVTRQITNTPADNEILSDITVSGTTVRVVWMVNGGATGNDVYATEFSVPVADLSIQKYGFPSTAHVGQGIAYGLVVHNLGPNTATDVLVTDPLPANTVFVGSRASQGSCTGPAAGSPGTVSCKLGNIVNGGYAFVGIAVKVTEGAGTTITNTATVGASTFDPTPNDNSASVSTTVAH